MRLIFLFTIVLIWCSCTKNEQKNMQGDFRFRNTTNKSINIDIYPTLEDYSNVSNLTRKVRVEALSSIIIPLADFEKNKDYYLDWYSDDYTISNWVMPPQNTSVHHYVKVTPSVQSSYTIQPTPNLSLIRKALLNNTKSSTTWDAVALTDGNGKGRFPLPAGLKLEITFRKNHSYTLVNNDKREEGIYETEFKASVQLNGNLKSATLGMGDSASSFYYNTADTMVYYDFLTSTDNMYLIVKRK